MRIQCHTINSREMWVRKTIIGHSLNIHRISNVIYIYFVRQFSMSAVYTRFVAWIQNDWRFRGSRNMAECGRLSESRRYGRGTHRLFWLCIYAIVQLCCFFSSFRRRLLVVSFVIESNISSFIFSALPLQQRNHSRRATEKSQNIWKIRRCRSMMTYIRWKYFGVMNEN